MSNKLKKLIEISSNSSTFKEKFKASSILYLAICLIFFSTVFGFWAYNEYQNYSWIKTENDEIYNKIKNQKYCIKSIEYKGVEIPERIKKLNNNCYCLMEFDENEVSFLFEKKVFKVDYEFVDFKKIRIDRERFLQYKLIKNYHIHVTPGGEIFLRNDFLEVLGLPITDNLIE